VNGPREREPVAAETTLLSLDDDDHWNNYSNDAAAVVVGIVEDISASSL